MRNIRIRIGGTAGIMTKEELFDTYLSEYGEKDNCWSLICFDDCNNGSEQMLFDICSYCMMQRLFLEKFYDDRNGMMAALRLFRFPAMHPAFKNRVDSVLPGGWLDRYMDHLHLIRHMFDQDNEMRRIFISDLLITAMDVRDWIRRLDDVFVKDEAESFRKQLDSFISECCVGVATYDDLISDFIMDGFEPGTPVYRAYKNMLYEIGV